MDKLLEIKTDHWDLTIWANGVDRRRHQLKRVIASRPNAEYLGSELRFSPAVKLKSFTLLKQAEEALEVDCQSLAIDSPVFFENTQYQLEWVFDKGVCGAAIHHKLSRIQDGFQFANSRCLARLFGSVNTGNDIGWFRLPLEYFLEGKRHSISISFEVLSTKILMHQDLPAMYQAIDKDYPLWRFSANSTAEQEASSSGGREKFPLMWLAQFEQLKAEFDKGLKVIANAPHSRLQANQNYKQADKIKGRITPKLAQKIQQDIHAKHFDKRYLVERKVLSVNTPENRFVKHITGQAKRILEQLHGKLHAANQKPEVDVYSEDYLDQVKGWQQPLQRMLSQPFMQEVGAYKDLNKVSLVLQQKAGYSSVYRVWQDLKLYLDCFDQQAFISMRTIAQIYEVWCFIALRDLLVQALGFKVVEGSKAGLREEGLEFNFLKNAKSCFHLERDDNTQLKLWHEPTYSSGSTPLKVFTESQRPDIVLGAIFEDGTQAYWLFDAKYRIDSQSEEADDRVPVDAINQMHRYRDAIIYSVKDKHRDAEQKSRPVAGAFALYPGYFEHQNKQGNPYSCAIKEVGIGAFALLPSQGGEHASWLKNYLVEQLGAKPVIEARNYANRYSDALYVREASRIPYHGMKQVRYSDLVMTAALAGKNGRQKEYFERFNNGTAQYYHTKKDVFESRYKQHIVNEIYFLALAVNDDRDSKYKQIDWLWPVTSVMVVPRYKITLDQAGSAGEGSELYYLFKLDKPIKLQRTIKKVFHRPIKHTFKLTTLKKLQQAEEFSALETVYPEALA